MLPCIEKARAIMQVLTVDMWSQKARQERMRLWRMYCSPRITIHTPDGYESTDYEEDCLELRFQRKRNALPKLRRKLQRMPEGNMHNLLLMKSTSQNSPKTQIFYELNLVLTDFYVVTPA